MQLNTLKPIFIGDFMRCRERCLKYKVTRYSKGGRYLNGQKRCQVCNIFMNFDSFHCPCCGFRLRSTPRGSKWKRMFIENRKDHNF